MRRTIAAIAAALGAASLALFPMVGASSSIERPLVIYETKGVGQGVVALFAVRPSIFDPLVQGGFLYTQAGASSQGGGAAYSIGSQAFPGTFVIGALGCGGLPGGTFVQGLYPETEDCGRKQESTIYTLPRTNNPTFDAVIERASFDFTHILAEADLGYGKGLAESLKYSLKGADNAPIITAKDFDVSSTSHATETKIWQETIVKAKDISLFDGGIHIESLTSRATTTSNGIDGSADANITFSGVTVTADGKARKARFTNTGITVTDPALTVDQRIELNERIEEGFARAGVSISLSSPNEIVDGPTAEASIGGLTIAVSGTLPSVTVPRELAPVLTTVLDQVPTKCLNDFGGPLPLCFGAGILPGSGSTFPLTLQLGGATAFSVGEFGPMGSGVVDTGRPPDLGPGPFTGGDQVGEFIPGRPSSTTTTPGASRNEPFVQRGPLTGLVGRLPAVALLWVAALFLTLALGVGLAPSIRHARRG